MKIFLNKNFLDKKTLLSRKPVLFLAVVFFVVSAFQLLLCAAAAQTCGDDCLKTGLVRCNGNGYQTCGNFDSDSCLEWGNVVSCGLNEICEEGACYSMSCSNECISSGFARCAGAGYQICGNYDGDSCLEWSATLYCDGGGDCPMECSSGVSCADDCSVSGVKQCGGNGYQTCGNYDSDSCLEWSAIVACASGESCSAGNCSADGACANDCAVSGVTQCSGQGYQVCGNYDSDPCLDWSPVNPCAKGRFCLSGSCLAVCQNECAFSGTTRCAAAGYQVCGNFDSDSCLEWGRSIACAAGKICNDGVCVNLVVNEKDKKAPEISKLSPSGSVGSSGITLECATDEPAICKCDAKDVDYDSMMEGMYWMENGYEHRRKLVLSDFGEYVYYVRCKDVMGNKNAVSARITFNYVSGEAAVGPLMMNLSPSGNVYQNEVMLELETDQPSECRYATNDGEFDQMKDAFASNDGMAHQTMIALNDPGSYTYYVRCRDGKGQSNNMSSVISFSYANPEKRSEDEEAACRGYFAGAKDGACDNRADCVCDPDCGSGAQDPDCAFVAGVFAKDLDFEKAKGVFSFAQNRNFIFVAAGISAALLLLVLFLKFKKRKNKIFAPPKKINESSVA